MTNFRHLVYHFSGAIVLNRQPAFYSSMHVLQSSEFLQIVPRTLGIKMLTAGSNPKWTLWQRWGDGTSALHAVECWVLRQPKAEVYAVPVYAWVRHLSSQQCQQGLGAARSPSPGTSVWWAQHCWVLCPCPDQVSADPAGNGDTQLTRTHWAGKQPIYVPESAAKPLLSVFSNETLHFLQYSSFLFSMVPWVTCSKLELGHHRHIFIHPVVLIHITPPTLAEFLALIHTQRKWISYCTQECVSHHTVHDWTICTMLCVLAPELLFDKPCPGIVIA